MVASCVQTLTLKVHTRSAESQITVLLMAFPEIMYLLKDQFSSQILQNTQKSELLFSKKILEN